jgi:hypothetical protein
MGVPFPLLKKYIKIRIFGQKTVVATITLPSCKNSTKGNSLIVPPSHKPISSIILMAT